MGTAIECTPAPCMRSSGCDGVTGDCMFSPEPDGTPCDQGACKNGSCVRGETPSIVDGGTKPGTQGADYWSNDEDGGCGCEVRGVASRWGAGSLLLGLIGMGLRRRTAGSLSARGLRVS